MARYGLVKTSLYRAFSIKRLPVIAIFKIQKCINTYFIWGRWNKMHTKFEKKDEKLSDETFTEEVNLIESINTNESLSLKSFDDL